MGVRAALRRGWPLKVSAELKGWRGPMSSVCELLTSDLTKTGGIERRNQDMSGNKRSQGRAGDKGMTREEEGGKGPRREF